MYTQAFIAMLEEAFRRGAKKLSAWMLMHSSGQNKYSRKYCLCVNKHVQYAAF